MSKETVIQNNPISKVMRYLKRIIKPFEGREMILAEESLKDEKPGQGIFNKTKRISLELSNLCNYAMIHKKCPLNRIKNGKILPSRIVYHILETCQKYDFQGHIAFHTYNEPGIDPRLMMFIKKARERLPKSKLILQTNGYYLDQGLAEEYEKTGLSILRISAYSEAEYKRLSKIKLNIPVTVQKMVLDNRLGLYSQAKIINSKQACHAPFNEVIVTNEGRISLCCLEWKRRHLFGDLNKETFEKAMRDKRMLAVYDNLSHGRRKFEICKRCTWSR